MDRTRAREALDSTNGDMDSAAVLLMSECSSAGGVSVGVSVGVSAGVQELAEMGGLSYSQARDELTAAGNNLELAKEKLLSSLGISTAPEKYSCLIHPSMVSNCPVCFDTPESCEELVQLQQCAHQFCRDCLQGWIAVEALASSTGSIKCPQQGCGSCLSHAELKELLADNEALFGQLDRRTLELLTG